MTNDLDTNKIDCDPEKSLELYELFQTPQADRDETWVEDFFEIIPHASLRGFDPQIQKGPDGFPYMILGLPRENEDFDAFSVAHATKFCLKKGCGIALFSDPQQLQRPEWVFSFGSLWAYSQFGNFIGDPNDEVPDRDNPLPKELFEKPRDIQVGAPSETYLPAFARHALKKFLKDVTGIETPKIALVTDPLVKPSRALMFADFRPERFEKEEHFKQLMTALRWFLPATRGLMIGVPELIDHAVPL